MPSIPKSGIIVSCEQTSLNPLQRLGVIRPKGGTYQWLNTKFFISFVQTLKKKLKNALVARFDSILTDNGATVVESKDWEKRRLAYEIQDFREGLYHIVNVEANDAVALNEFDRLSKINGDILRHMIVKVDA